MSLAPEKVGLFLRSQAEELARIWRIARATERTEVFPGLLDGVVEPFFARAGELLATGGAPEEVWRGLVGVVRWSPTLAPAELTHEWAVVMEVVSAACESVNAARKAAEWLAAAVAAAERGTAALDAGRGEAPPGILTTVVFSSLSPRQPGADPEGAARG